MKNYREINALHDEVMYIKLDLRRFVAEFYWILDSFIDLIYLRLSSLNYNLNKKLKED
jgi:hypothetical protein